MTNSNCGFSRNPAVNFDRIPLDRPKPKRILSRPLRQIVLLAFFRGSTPSLDTYADQNIHGKKVEAKGVFFDVAVTNLDLG
jgi:hypothetical protein